jgi:hypothetical protein
MNIRAVENLTVGHLQVKEGPPTPLPRSSPRLLKASSEAMKPIQAVRVR